MQAGGRIEPVTATPVELKWEDLRCRSCRRLLCKTTVAIRMRVTEAIEIKCAKCDALNYLMGRPD